MKTRERYNPLPVKTENGNNEPWLTYRELLEEAKAVSRSYLQLIQNGRGITNNGR